MGILYLLLVVSSALLLITLKLISLKKDENLGFVYLFLLTLKLVVLGYLSSKMNLQIPKVEKLIFVLACFFFSFVEVYFCAKLLKDV
ncbi:MAG: hypothetical protein C4K58_01375 [Flavobacteriaceae bacterium]|nr:MAG: hypothetical protein C4K58_01375 [Flavobacteriaceae bacterium]